MIGNISITGQIGAFETIEGVNVDEYGTPVNAVTLIDVIQQYKAVKDNPVIQVKINSPGGYISDGDEIYNFLESLKKKHTVNTISSGNIGSIATKIFLVGQERLIKEGHEFFIHNPWVNAGSGDSNYMLNVSESLKEEEEKLRKFYLEKTEITEEGLEPLMRKETSLNADQAVIFGFATKKIADVKALAMIKINSKNNKMANENKGILARIKSLLNQEDEEEAKALLVDLEGGQQISVVTEDDTLEEKPAYVATEGVATETPAPDGEHKLADGRIITVVDGVIKSVSEAPESMEEDEDLFAKILEVIESQNQKIEAQNEQIKAVKEAHANNSKAIQDAITAMTETKKDEEEEISNKIEASLKALRDEIIVGRKPKAGKQFSRKEDEEEWRPSAIQRKMMEKATEQAKFQ